MIRFILRVADSCFDDSAECNQSQPTVAILMILILAFSLPPKTPQIMTAGNATGKKRKRKTKRK
jgi:hypothetical protein